MTLTELSEKVVHIETLMVERHGVQKNEFDEIKMLIRGVNNRLDAIEASVRANKAEHDKVINRGWGILSACIVAGGFVGALIKSWLAEVLSRF